MDSGQANSSVLAMMKRAPDEAERHLIRQPLGLTYRGSPRRRDPK